MGENSALLQQIQQEVKSLYHRLQPGEKLHYVCQDWIMPHHIDLVVDWSNKLSDKYHADKEICAAASLLHDAGLVYKRVSNSIFGHENHSAEFAEIILEKLACPAEKKERIINCIKATELNNEPKNIEEKVVRTSDVMAQIFSIHFLAKSYFYNNWYIFIDWLDEKIEKASKKICLDDEKKSVEPIIDYYRQIIDLHRQKQNEYDQLE